MSSDGSASTTPTREQTITVPTKATRERRRADEMNENKMVCLPDGPSLAFTDSGVRIYDSDMEEYRQLTNAELAELLADIYRVE